MPEHWILPSSCSAQRGVVLRRCAEHAQEALSSSCTSCTAGRFSAQLGASESEAPQMQALVQWVMIYLVDIR